MKIRSNIANNFCELYASIDGTDEFISHYGHKNEWGSCFIASYNYAYWYTMVIVIVFLSKKWGLSRASPNDGCDSYN